MMCTKFMVLLGYCPTPVCRHAPQPSVEHGVLSWGLGCLSGCHVCCFAARRLFVLSYSCATSRWLCSLHAACVAHGGFCGPGGAGGADSSAVRLCPSTQLCCQASVGRLHFCCRTASRPHSLLCSSGRAYSPPQRHTGMPVFVGCFGCSQGPTCDML
jgi:hypothetical protein